MRFVSIASIGLFVTFLVFSRPARAAVPAGRAAQETVALRLVVGDTPARLSIPDGGMAKITLRNQQVIGLIPTVDPDRTILRIVAVVAKSATAKERTQEIGEVTLTLGVVNKFSGIAVPLEMELTGVTTATGGAATEPSGPCLTCCVSCNGYLICSCRVETDCGGCCCPAACSCSGTLALTPCAGDSSQTSHAVAKKHRRRVFLQRLTD